MPGLNLTRVEAEERARIVKPHAYQVELDLTRGERVFTSKTTIEFSAEAGASTFVDFVCEELHSVTLNGNEVDLGAYRDNRIHLDHLADHNTVVVDATCPYMHTGEGLHGFTDPADGERYCYSQFEVADARRVFANFEQPDLKATFQFTIKAPENWKVFSNAPTPEPTLVEEGKEYAFAPTEVISTYIVAIVAGPYAGVTSEYTSTDGRTIPLGVYCRQSLFEYLDSDLILEVTKQGFGFFENAYGIPYPFAKYDQVFVPEYNAGAMENAGLVTFRDQYIFRSQPTDWQLESRTNTILHELAHMWFGDLVTMQWWDDLWLNESFAEFMAHHATSEATRWKDAWIGFLKRKEWGMKHDQMPTTHPIRAEINDLNDVEVNFDGITYAKGAAVLRQLVTYVGAEQFFQGLGEYLRKHSYSNATLADLLSELETASGRDLQHWAKVWLEESGITALRADTKVNGGKYEEVIIEQSAFSPQASLRPMRIAIAGYGLDEGRVKQVFRHEVDIDGAKTSVPELVGTDVPELLVINDGDLGYAKVRLAPEAVAYIRDNIDKFDDALTRRVLLSAAWDMTRDGELAASIFIDIALRDAIAEDNTSTLTGLLAQIAGAATLYTAPGNRSARLEEVGNRLLLLAKSAPAATDQQRLFVESLAALAVTTDQFSFLEGIYGNTTPLHGLSVDNDLKWELLQALVRGGLAGASAIDEMRASDPTMVGEQNTQRARAALNSPEGRDETWRAVMHDTSISNDTRWAMVEGFWSHADTEPLAYAQYVERFFDEAVQAWNTHTFHIASGLIESMFPVVLSGYLGEINIVECAEKWLEEHRDQPASFRRLMEEQTDSAARMLIAQKADQKGTE